MHADVCTSSNVWRFLVGLDRHRDPPLLLWSSEFRNLAECKSAVVEFDMELNFCVNIPLDVLGVTGTREQEERLLRRCKVIKITSLFDSQLATMFNWTTPSCVDNGLYCIKRSFSHAEQFSSDSVKWSGETIKAQYLSWSVILDFIHSLVPHSSRDVMRAAEVSDDVIALRLLRRAFPLFENAEPPGELDGVSLGVIHFIQGKTLADIHPESLHALARGGLTVIQVKKNDRWRAFSRKIADIVSPNDPLERSQVFTTVILGVRYLLIGSCSTLPRGSTLSLKTRDLDSNFFAKVVPLLHGDHIWYYDWEFNRWFDERRWHGCTWAPSIGDNGKFRTYGGLEKWTSRRRRKIVGVSLLDKHTFSFATLKRLPHMDRIEVRGKVENGRSSGFFTDAIAVGARPHMFNNLNIPLEMIVHIQSFLSLLDVCRLFSPLNRELWKSYEELRFVANNCGLTYDRSYDPSLVPWKDPPPLSCLRALPALTTDAILSDLRTTVYREYSLPANCPLTACRQSGRMMGTVRIRWQIAFGEEFYVPEDMWQVYTSRKGCCMILLDGYYFEIVDPVTGEEKDGK